MGLTLPFPCCFAITAGRAGSKHCHTSAAPGTPRGVCVCVYIYVLLTQHSLFNFCSMEYRR